jgi:flagellar motor switch protein FliN/FliY
MGEDEAALSDDEIEALLDEEEEGEETGSAEEPEGIDPDELLETYRELSESVQNVLSTILNRDASQSVESLAMLSPTEVDEKLEDQPESLVMITSELEGAVEGTARYLLDEQDALLLADVMMGQEGENPPEEFDEVYESAIVEMFNQVVNSIANQIDELTGQAIDLSAPESQVVTREEISETVADESLWVEYAFEVEDLIDSGHFIEIQPGSLGEMIWEAQQSEPEPDPEPESDPEPSQSEPAQQQQSTSEPQSQEQAEVQSVKFPQFDATEAEESSGTMSMLMDVPMEVSVQLGRTKLQVKEILNLGQGSIIELERLAGEPVDLLVNGRLVARGEVVVIDESFGVRVTSIVSPMDRIK